MKLLTAIILTFIFSCVKEEFSSGKINSSKKIEKESECPKCKKKFSIDVDVFENTNAPFECNYVSVECPLCKHQFKKCNNTLHCGFSCYVFYEGIKGSESVFGSLLYK